MGGNGGLPCRCITEKTERESTWNTKFILSKWVPQSALLTSATEASAANT